ncbi:MAG: hypothetical protein COA33_014000 [Fluviicola sp.]|nr:hypothetical protein [Fluviicola sp.]
MRSITDDEIDFILADIERKGIVTEDVRYNILDHVCCIIENELPQNGNFKEFYRNTIARFYKKELLEIERETENLLTFKYYFAMKRTLKIIGLLSVIFILLGAVFKAMHWPGAGVIIVSGFFFFCFIFIPLNIILTFRDDKKATNRLVITLGMILTTTGIFGLLFKVMHWPLANILFQGSLAVFGLVFIPLYFFIKTRNPETKFNAIINTTFMVAAAGMLFTLLQLRPSHHTENKEKMMIETQSFVMQQLKNTNKQLLLSQEVKSAEHANFIKISKQLLAQLDENNAPTALLSSINEYNEKISEIGDTSLKSMDKKSVDYLPENSYILKLQIISNENAYLCLANNN